MIDINGKEIKAGMCLEILYDDDTGVGVGEIIEESGELGFIDLFDDSFHALSEIDKDMIKGFLIVKG